MKYKKFNDAVLRFDGHELLSLQDKQFCLSSNLLVQAHFDAQNEPRVFIGIARGTYGHGLIVTLDELRNVYERIGELLANPTRFIEGET